MNSLKQIGWSFLTLMALVCLSFYVTHHKPIIKLDNDTLSTTPDAIITDLTFAQFDTNGHISHYLQTQTVQHIPKNDTHYLLAPHITISQNKQAPWQITANKATAIKTGQQIIFQNNVIIRQKKASAQETLLTTEELTYFPQKQFATTAQSIRLSQAGTLVTSTGMNAYLADNRVQLLSNARAVYEANHG